MVILFRLRLEVLVMNPEELRVLVVAALLTRDTLLTKGAFAVACLATLPVGMILSVQVVLAAMVLGQTLRRASPTLLAMMVDVLKGFALYPSLTPVIDGGYPSGLTATTLAQPVRDYAHTIAALTQLHSASNSRCTLPLPLGLDSCLDLLRRSPAEPMNQLHPGSCQV